MVLLFVLICFFNSTKAQVFFQTIELDSSISLAKNNHRLLLVDFRADWCKPCLEMEQTTFKDSLLGTYVNDRFIAIKVDVDDSIGRILAQQYSVSEYPTILTINPLDRKILLRIIGFKPARILIGDLKMLERYLPAETKKN